MSTARSISQVASLDGEERFRALFFQAPVGIAETGLHGEWLLLNDRLCEVLGFTQAELRGTTFLDITHPDDREASLEAVRRLLAGEISSHVMEKRFVRKDGTIFWGRLFKSLVRDRDNRPQSFLSVVEDITERVRAEGALRESEQRLRLVQNAAHLGVCEWDLRTNTLAYSGEYAELYGFPPHHPLRREELRERIHPDDQARVQAGIKEAHERARAWNTEYRVVWPDGSVHWLLSKGTVFLDESAKACRTTGVVLDITENKRVEAELRETEQRFRTMADAAPVMIWVAGPDKLCTFFNKRCLEFTGHSLEEKIGDGWIATIHPADREGFLATFASSFDTRQEFQASFRLRRADGEYRWVLTVGAPRFTTAGVFAGYVGSCLDMTEMKRAQEEALAHQKMESLGVLAGGIAHDFNNFLGSILSYSELLLQDSPPDLPAHDGIERIRTVAVRAAEIVRELMAYGGQESPVFEAVDLSKLVGEMLHLLKVSISKRAVLNIDLPERLPAVQANAAQMRQVVMNLITNASDALGEEEGVISVRVSPAPASSLDGNFVRLEVSDSGCGMTDEIRARIFDPFFTTKFAGRGLGLAAVQGIIRRHGGVIHVASAPGQGSRFEILLPSTGEPSGQAHAPRVSAAAGEAGDLTRTVFIVEDEDSLRDAVSKMLRRKGFDVIEARDGESGVDLYRARAREIDVVLLDMTLPGIFGQDVLFELRRIQPEVKVIITTAYSREWALTKIGGQQPWHYIRKPFSIGELMGLLAEVVPLRMSGSDNWYQRP